MLSLFLTRIDKIVQTLKHKELLIPFIKNGVFAAAEHRKILNSELSTIVDIGANRGQFALASRKWAKNAKVISFEPLARPSETFRKVFLYDKNVTLFQAAIGNFHGVVDMHISACDDSSSILPISLTQEKIFPGTGEITKGCVRIGKLNEFISFKDINPQAMLKIDVQGYELETLKGCEDFLEHFKFVYVECSFVELYYGQALADSIIEWLHNRGFILQGVYNMNYDQNGIAIQGDFLFQKEKNIIYFK